MRSHARSDTPTNWQMQLIRVFGASLVGSEFDSVEGGGGGGGGGFLLSGFNPVGSVAACFCGGGSLVETLVTKRTPTERNLDKPK